MLCYLVVAEEENTEAQDQGKPIYKPIIYFFQLFVHFSLFSYIATVLPCLCAYCTVFHYEMLLFILICGVLWCSG